LRDKWRKRKNGLQRLRPEAVEWMDNTLAIEMFPEPGDRYIPNSDILVASAWQNAEFASQLPIEKGKFFYFVLHYESLWTRHKNRALKTYDLSCEMIAISTWLKKTLIENHGKKSDLLVTPVDPKVFFCEQKKWNSIPRIAMLHHDYGWKGYAEGIEVIKIILEKGKKVELVVFGEKSEDPRSLFDKAGFEFEYHYRPTRERLRKIYESCDIFLCPSWYEGLGIPSMEAMACRCALVTSDTGGCLDYAINGKTALVSPPQDIEGLSENIIRLLDDNKLMESISQNGHEKISEFDWCDSCRQLVGLFEKSLNLD
jgi:glycosyltransferase involved in cell wall biosynthesis